MKSIKAILIMSIWTIFALIILYLFDAHINYRQIQWSIGIALALLIVKCQIPNVINNVNTQHMSNAKQRRSARQKLYSCVMHFVLLSKLQPF